MVNLRLVSKTDHAYSGDEPLVILDTLEDWRFAKNVRPMLLRVA